MKTILCYGDSNTWGFNPRTLDRYGPHERWPGVLRDALGPGFHVVEEGLNGRTTCFPDPFDPQLDGKAYLLPCLKSHKPLDLVVLMLGTNDLKTRFSAAAVDIAWGAGVLVDLIQRSQCGPPRATPPATRPAPASGSTVSHPLPFVAPPATAPQVLLIAPPPIKPPPDPEAFANAIEKSRQFAIHYRRIAELYDCHYLDAGQVIESGAADGIHLDAAAHAALGQAVARRVQAILA